MDANSLLLPKCSGGMLSLPMKRTFLASQAAELLGWGV